MFFTHPTAVTVPTHPSSNTTVTASVRMLIVFKVLCGGGALRKRLAYMKDGDEVKWVFVVDGRRVSKKATTKTEMIETPKKN